MQTQQCNTQIKPSRPPPDVVRASSRRGYHSHCLAAKHRTTPGFHQYFLHYRKPNVQCSRRTRHRSQGVWLTADAYTVIITSLLMLLCLDPIAINDFRAPRCMRTLLAASTCSFGCRMRKLPSTSGESCLVAQTLYKSAPHVHRRTVRKPG